MGGYLLRVSQPLPRELLSPQERVPESSYVLDRAAVKTDFEFHTRARQLKI
jgi:hypothetical protein